MPEGRVDSDKKKIKDRVGTLQEQTKKRGIRPSEVKKEDRPYSAHRMGEERGKAARPQRTRN